MPRFASSVRFAEQQRLNAGRLVGLTDYADVPEEVLAEMRAICAGLPEAYEEQAWTGKRWRIRKRTFVHVFAIDSPRGPFTAMQFRSEGPELDILRHAGHPFFAAGWGKNVVGMVLGNDTNWTEVGELVTESFCIMAPKKLAAQVAPPNGETPP